MAVTYTVDFAHFGAGIAQQRQQHIDSVEHDPGRAELPSLRLENGQHAGQLELPGLHDRRGESSIEKKYSAPGERRQGPAERSSIREDLVGRFLEGNEDAALLALLCRVDESLQREDGFARARTAHDQGRPVPWQSTAAELVKPRDARSQLGQARASASLGSQACS